MAFTWPLLGPYLALTCQDKNEVNLDKTSQWPLLGPYLAFTWPVVSQWLATCPPQIEGEKKCQLFIGLGGGSSMTYNPEKKTESTTGVGGRPGGVPKISAYEAKQEALLMIRRGLVKPSSKLYQICGLLGTAGVLTQENLLELGSVSERTLRRYRQKGILDLVPAPKKINDLLGAGRVWALGPIGIQLSKIQLELVPTGYLESQIDNISHDVLCNYVYVKIYRAARSLGYTAILKGKYEASIKDFRNTQILQPDAMIILRNRVTQEDKVFVVEYHNENYSSRAAEKIKKYEHVYREGYWRSQWHLDRFPTILVATTHQAPAIGYENEIKEYMQGAGVKCTYLVKSLKKLLDDTQSPLDWFYLEKNKPINLLKI